MSEPRTPSPLLQTLGNALEFALNRALALDERAQAALRSLDGHAIELEWAGVGLGLRAELEQGRVRVGPRGGAEPALSVSSTLAGLAAMLFPGGGAPSGKVKMSGDVELARRLEQITREFAPDFEGALRARLGDPAAAVIARALRSALAFARDSAARLAEDAADYVRDESRATVAGDELREFHVEVDRLRDAGERLAARVAQLQTRLTERD